MTKREGRGTIEEKAKGRHIKELIKLGLLIATVMEGTVFNGDTKLTEKEVLRHGVFVRVF